MALANISIPLSGFNAASTRIAVSAKNIAKINIIDNAAKERVNQAFAEHGGVETNIQTIPIPEGTIAAPEQGLLRTNISHAEELIQMEIGKISGDVSLRSFEVEDQNLQRLLDIKI